MKAVGRPKDAVAVAETAIAATDEVAFSDAARRSMGEHRTPVLSEMARIAEDPRWASIMSGELGEEVKK